MNTSHRDTETAGQAVAFAAIREHDPREAPARLHFFFAVTTAVRRGHERGAAYLAALDLLHDEATAEDLHRR